MDTRIPITRNQLYERVWSVPLKILAAEFGISDVRLGKICRKHGIPLPVVGYWAKIKAGQHVEKKELPPHVNMSIRAFPVITEPQFNDHQIHKRIKELEKQASEWNRCEIIRAYLKAVEAAAIKKFGVLEKGSPINNWLKSCYDYVKCLDPSNKLVNWFELDSNPVVRNVKK